MSVSATLVLPDDTKPFFDFSAPDVLFGQVFDSAEWRTAWMQLMFPKPGRAR